MEPSAGWAWRFDNQNCALCGVSGETIEGAPVVNATLIRRRRFGRYFLKPRAVWCDIDIPVFACPSKDGILGLLYQVKLGSTGTYAGTNLRIDVVPIS
jgi:hypothetical protein